MDEDVTFIQYSLDGGYTWRPYTGPFPVPSNALWMGLPDPLVDEDGEEGVSRGPGRYLVLAASRDESGNEEYPPAQRIIYIEPILLTGTPGLDAGPIGGAGDEGEGGTTTRPPGTRTVRPTATPTRTLTPSPTNTPTPSGSSGGGGGSGGPPTPTNTPETPIITVIPPTNTPFISCPYPPCD
jgi:hypothetical protein